MKFSFFTLGRYPLRGIAFSWTGITLNWTGYCQEWEIDQLLQFCRRNFICLIFAWFFKAKYSTKICPS